MIGQYSQNISWNSHRDSQFIANSEKSTIVKTRRLGPTYLKFILACNIVSGIIGVCGKRRWSNDVDQLYSRILADIFIMF